MEEKRIDIPVTKSAHLALWKIFNQDSEVGKDIFLTHGTFSNRKVCMGISEYLVNSGYTCWILEWRNHGSSSMLKDSGNFERIGKEDIQHAMDYLFTVEKIEKIDCITHSGGGISLTINLLENPNNIKRIRKIVFFGCQAFGAAHSHINRFTLVMAKYVSKLLGFIPAKLLGRPHNEDYPFMKQWFNWNLSRQFVDGAGKDYTLEMPRIQIPILSISGSGDRLIAPISGCKAYLQQFTNPNNKFLQCGKATGYREDYSHSRLIYSRNAERELYPVVLQWIMSNTAHTVISNIKS